LIIKALTIKALKIASFFHYLTIMVLIDIIISTRKIGRFKALLLIHDTKMVMSPEMPGTNNEVLITLPFLGINIPFKKFGGLFKRWKTLRTPLLSIHL
jgi:hypothetical protein